MKLREGDPFEILRAKIKKLPKDIRSAFVVGVSVSSQAPLKEHGGGVIPKEIQGVPLVFDERIGDHEISCSKWATTKQKRPKGNTVIRPGDDIDTHLEPWWTNWLIGDEIL